MTIILLEDQMQSEKIKIHPVYINLEKFISRKFDFFNLLIYKWSSLLNTTFNMSALEIHLDFKKNI